MKRIFVWVVDVTGTGTRIFEESITYAQRRAIERKKDVCVAV
jgi:hypothetical protein